MYTLSFPLFSSVQRISILYPNEAFSTQTSDPLSTLLLLKMANLWKIPLVEDSNGEENFQNVYHRK